MTQPSLLTNIPARSMAQASREAFDRILPTLTARELLITECVDNYLATTGRLDVTGGELSLYTGIPLVSVRPRLSGAQGKGWLRRTEQPRASLVASEARSHAYSRAVPRDAIDRAVRALGSNEAR